MKLASKLVVTLAVWLCVVMLIYYIPDLPSYNEPIMSGIAIAAFIASIAVVVIFDED